MKIQREKRIKKKLLVHISENGFERIGITANISQNGLCIATTEIFPLQSELLIWIAAADDIFAMKGVVKWSTEKNFPDVEGISAGIGVKIKEAPPGYAQYIALMAKNQTPNPDGIAGKKSQLGL